MKSKAFTLVELLVVMAIISFLSVGAFAGLSFGLRQARDVQKKKIVDLAQTALQAYYADYAAYPKCANGQSPAGATAPGWYVCTDSFPRPSSTAAGFLINNAGVGGVKDYLEGEWPSTNANADPGATSEYLRYYVFPGTGGATSTPLKYAVCVTVENKNSSTNLIRKGSSPATKDCYCAGTEYSDVACIGMAGR